MTGENIGPKKQIPPFLRNVLHLFTGRSVAQALFNDKANGSEVKDESGQVVGSSLIVRSGLGLIQLGAGFLVLVAGATAVANGAATPVLFIFLIYLLHTTGELCLSPVGLSMVTKLAPARMQSLMMGIWFFSFSLSNLLAGFVAAQRYGRAVKWIEDRREHLMCANHSRDPRHLAKLALDLRRMFPTLESEESCAAFGEHELLHLAAPRATALANAVAPPPWSVKTRGGPRRGPIAVRRGARRKVTSPSWTVREPEAQVCTTSASRVSRACMSCTSKGRGSISARSWPSGRWRAGRTCRPADRRTSPLAGRRAGPR